MLPHEFRHLLPLGEHRPNDELGEGVIKVGTVAEGGVAAAAGENEGGDLKGKQ